MRASTLTRRFSAVSLVLLAIAAAVLGVLFRWHEIDQLEDMTEARNVALTLAIGSSLADDVARLVAHSGERSAAVLATLPESLVLREKLLPIFAE